MNMKIIVQRLISSILFLTLLLFSAACKQETKADIQNSVPPAFSYRPDMQRLQKHYRQISEAAGGTVADTAILIDGYDNKLFLVQARSGSIDILKSYDISASKYGYGAERGSNQTPGGIHMIAGKYGDEQPLGMSFYDRRPTGEIATIYTDSTNVDADPVTSRIIWLKGMEEGNRTSYWRFIYIHGTHEEGLIGTPQSKGCIRMRNEDVIELFDMVREGMYVNIIEPDTIRSGDAL